MRQRTLLFFIILLIGIGAGIASWQFERGAAAHESEPTYAEQTAAALAVDGAEETMGPKDAPVRIIAYLNTDDTASDHARSLLTDLHAAHPNALRIVIRDFTADADRARLLRVRAAPTYFLGDIRIATPENDLVLTAAVERAITLSRTK